MTTTSQPGLTLPLLPLSSLLGLVGLGSGIYGLTNPLAFSSTLGVPLASNNANAALPFVSFVAARNLGSGITLLTLCALGSRKGVGIVLMAGVVTAFADAWICSKFGGSGKSVSEFSLFHPVLPIFIII